MKLLITPALLFVVLLSFPLLLAARSLDELRAEAEKGDAETQIHLGAMYQSGSGGVAKDPTEAAKWYRKAAEEGNARAQYRLGAMSVRGEGVSKDLAGAVKWLRKAAEQGYVPAQYDLFEMYLNGNGVSKDEFEAVKWIQKAGEHLEELRAEAERGDADAQRMLGEAYLYGWKSVAKNRTEAAKWYRKAAEQGDARAPGRLFWMYFYPGDGVPQEREEAIKWLQLAADRGDADAQSTLGSWYSTGLVLRKDAANAVKWTRKAAEQGDPFAQCSLGSMYLYGKDVAKDVAEAVKWLQKAAEQGDVSAQYLLGWMYASGEDVSKDMAQAAKWFRKIVENDDELALYSLSAFAATVEGVPERKSGEQVRASVQYRLGLMYANGEGVTKDAAEAMKWYRKAADQGNAEAQCNLGLMYDNGEGVPKDQAEAVKWYRKAAEQGNAVAQGNLGNMYANGDGLPKDSAEAVRWYRKAAEQGNAGAQSNLGVMYVEGVGVLKDEIEALAWYTVSSASGNDVAVKNRASLERRLGRDGTLAAQQRAKEIFNEIEAAKARQTASKSSPLAAGAVTAALKSSGSGAIVSAQGHVLTAAHVVAHATTLSVVTANGTWPATVLRIDEANDIAILKISRGAYSPLHIAPSRRVRLGQAVATIGFPNIGFQGFSPKVTRGEISSANGFADDPRSWQISVPVQPGNSGGPLLDENGNLIGVVIAKLGLKAAAVTGDMPQNVNYAVKSAYALALLEPYLDANAPEPKLADQRLSFEDMVAKAQQSVVLILTY